MTSEHNKIIKKLEMVIASAPELRINQLIYNAIITKFPEKSKPNSVDDFYNVTDADFLEALDHYYIVINERDK